MNEALKSLYLEEVDGIKRCTAEEMEQLFMEGSDEAKARLIEGNLFRVTEAARFFESPVAAFMDLVQEGSLALTMFVHAQDGFSKSTEAEMDAAIDEALRTYAAQEEDSRKAGEELSVRLNVLNEVCVKLAEELGREATAEEVGKKVNMDPEDVRYLMRIALTAVNKDNN